MSVTPRLLRARDAPPATLPLLALWLLQAWPRRGPGLAAIEMALGACVIILTPGVRRSAVACLVECRLDRGSLSLLAAGLGIGASLCAAALDVAGRLPAGLHDPRGGPVSFLAVSATLLWLDSVASRTRRLPGRDEPEALADRPWIPAACAGALGALAIALLEPREAPAAILGAMGLLAALAIDAVPRVPGTSKLRAVWFEKSSLVHWEAAEVTAVVPLQPELEPGTVLGIACAVEASIFHPLRDVLLRALDGQARTVPSLRDVRYLPGLGVRARLHDDEILLGSASLLGQAGLPDSQLATARDKLAALSAAGDSVIFLAIAGELAGAIGVRCPAHPAAAACIREVRGLGLPVGLVTRDAEAAARGFASPAIFDEVHAGLTPTGRDALLEARRPGGELVALVQRRAALPASPGPACLEILLADRVEGLRTSEGLGGVAWSLRSLLGSSRLESRRARLVWSYHLAAVPACAAAAALAGGSSLPVLLAAGLGASFPRLLELVFPHDVSHNRHPFAKVEGLTSCTHPPRTPSSSATACPSCPRTSSGASTS